MTDDREAARQALELIASTRAALGARVHLPWKFDLLYGLGAGGLVAAFGLPQPFHLAVALVSVLVLLVYLRAWVRVTGVWVNGVRPRRARWVGLAVGGLVAMLAVVALHFDAPLLAGSAAAVVAFAGSRLWLKVYQAELRVPT